MTDIRPFARADRDQLTALVNAHVTAVVPGWALSTAALLASLERDPGQYVTDPWVVERRTLVALERDRVVAAAHLRRYGADAGGWYAGAGEVAWLVCWPQHAVAGSALAAACTRVLDAWGVRRQLADGDLPTPATYGVHDAWPHVRALLVGAGFSDAGARTEVHVAGGLDAVPAPGRAPLPGLQLQRGVGVHAARCSAVLDGREVGLVEAVDDHTRGGALSCLAGWADLAELHVARDLRGRGVGTWLLAHQVAWLRLGGTQRLLVAVGEDDAHLEPWFARLGWHRTGTTRRGWERPVAG